MGRAGVKAGQHVINRQLIQERSMNGVDGLTREHAPTDIRLVGRDHQKKP
jgi:hypothetical protein